MRVCGSHPCRKERGKDGAPGNCICPEYIGTFCCGVAAYNFYYNCGACQGAGNQDIYIECPHGTCCWISYACRPGG